MQDLDVRYPPRHADRTTRMQLADFDAYVRWMWPALPYPMTIEWSNRLVLAFEVGMPRIYGPADLDPLRTPDGAAFVPRMARKLLRRTLTWGVPIHCVGIIHELDPAGPVRERLDELRAAPRTCGEDEARALIGEIPTDPWVARILRISSKVRETGIFGVVAPTPPQYGALCLWYELAAWRW